MSKKIITKGAAAVLATLMLVGGAIPVQAATSSSDMTTLEVNNVGVKSAVIKNDKTGIPDKTLYNYILRSLDKKKGDTFTEEEAEKIYGLDIWDDVWNDGVKTLQGIDKLTNLKKLEIHDDMLTSLSGIEKLKSLEEFIIAKGKLSDFSILTKVNALKTLTIEEKKVTDLTSLSEMTGLTSMHLISCDIDDDELATITKNMTKLNSILVTNNKLKSLKAIEHLTQLQVVSVDQNCITDISGIDKLTQVKALDVSNNKLRNIDGVKDLSKLENLDINNNKLTNIKSVQNLTKLTMLEASNNSIKKLPDLTNHAQLNIEFTNFFGNKISLKDMKSKLPKHLTDVAWWLKNQYITQKLSWKLKVNKVKKITSKTKTIIGTSEKKARITIETAKGKKIATVKSNSKGGFKLKKLNLKKWRKKILYINCYMKYEDNINGEYHWKLLKKTRIKVK